MKTTSFRLAAKDAIAIWVAAGRGHDSGRRDDLIQLVAGLSEEELRSTLMCTAELAYIFFIMTRPSRDVEELAWAMTLALDERFPT